LIKINPLRSNTRTMNITRRENFNAAHKLFKPEWSDEKNLEVFGACANPNWHGHNYILYVTVKGKPNPETGFVMNLKRLSQLIRRHITEQVDHKNLNLDVPFMNGILPSAENIAKVFWQQLSPHIEKEGCSLHCIKIQETENNSVEYFGD
jgi:6-pyruvoyltetrahydropterin/6-carboxytetrahydropterin synthase